MSLALSLATSAMTILSMWLVGKKRHSGWMVGLFNQVFWLLVIIDTRAWGLLVLTGFLLVVYTRNLWEWTRPT